VLCMILVDYMGRRRCLWLFMIGTSIFTTPLLRGDAPDPGQAYSDLDTISLFCTRMFAYGSFVVLFIYTPELYPTQIRSFAFGLYNAFSRLGGLVSPFIAVDLFEKVCTVHCALVCVSACSSYQCRVHYMLSEVS
jgi:MFS family permease